MFTTPSKRNRCLLTNDQVACVIPPSGRGASQNNLVILTKDGYSTQTGDLGAAADSNTWQAHGSDGAKASKESNVLKYGQSITDGTITCNSSENGFHCSSKHGWFTVNSSGAKGATIHSD